MPDQKIAELLHELIVSTRIMANEKVLDAFGHVSVRHPGDPKRYFIPRHRAPELAEISDIVELNLDSEPIKPTEFRLYSERVIHGEIYKARPEVNAVVHHHAHAVLPYAISGREMVPVFHLGAVIGQVPFWDQRDEFGDTNMLVIKPEEGASLARALGPHWMVLMRRHGATVAGMSLRELTFRTCSAATTPSCSARPSPTATWICSLRAKPDSPRHTNCGRRPWGAPGILGAPGREGRFDAGASCDGALDRAKPKPRRKAPAKTKAKAKEAPVAHRPRLVHYGSAIPAQPLR